MENNSPILFIEIDISEIIFVVSKKDDSENYEILFKDRIDNQNTINFSYADYNLTHDLLKKKIYFIEQKLNFTFKEVIISLQDIDFSILNVSGFKNLNGAQLTRENITYILNSLKTQINELEKKTVLHIFNTKYILDKKKTENLPLGLYGNFYSQEHSFILIENNDYKNLKNIFEKCNLKINRIISKSFLGGIDLISKNENCETFFKFEIGKKFIQLIYFENSSLKFIQRFDFGIEIIINDISKIIALKKETIEKIISDKNFFSEDVNDSLISEKYFENQNFRKIKKKLLIDISYARIDEIFEIILFKNSNVLSLLKKDINVFLNFEESIKINFFQKLLTEYFLKKNELNFIISKKPSTEDLAIKALQLVQFGWKKEALPIVNEKKTIISRIFGLFFK